jgi:hypothetical protein
MWAQPKYWTYKVTELTPDVWDLPPGVFNGTQNDWCKLSPGMRREILRSWKRRQPVAFVVPPCPVPLP